MTFVLDNRLSAAGAFGVKPGKKTLAEVGALAVANYKRKLAENINLVTSSRSSRLTTRTSVTST